jgi:SH3-like domain-containing protein
MQNKPSGVLYRNSLSQSRWVWIVVSLVIVLPQVIGLVFVVGRAYAPLFREFFNAGGSNPPSAAVTPTADPALTPTHQAPVKPTEAPIAAPKPSPTPKPPLTVVWSKEYSQVYLRQEPGGAIICLLDNGSSLLISEIQTVQGMEWAHVLYFDGEEDQGGWVAASLVFTIRSDLPSAQVIGENGANLRSEPGDTLVAWLPNGTPVQIIETAEVDGVVWAHVILPDERGGWVAQRLLSSNGP